MRLPTMVVLAIMFGTLPSIILGVAFSEQLQRDREKLTLTQCNASNISRAYLRQDASRNARQAVARRTLADALFPLRDCAKYASSNGANQGTVPTAVVVEFIARVARGRQPVIENNRIIDR